MNLTKTITTVGVGAAIVAGSMLAVTAASAHGGDTSERAAAIAERFDLDEAEVQTYFEEQKAERQADREAAREAHVASLIEAGTLTQEQADQLAAFKDNFKAEAEALKESGAEREEVKAAMEENRTEVEAWAAEQGINLDDIRPEGGKKGGRGHGPRGGSDS